MKIGDIVFVLGRYLPCGKTHVVEAKIDHIEHRQFVAYNVEGYGEWRFSKKHIGKSVFNTFDAAKKVLGEE